MPTFSGQLRTNVIQSALFNMIISQDIIGGSIRNNYNLVDQAEAEAGLYGDTKLYIDTPTLTPDGTKMDASYGEAESVEDQMKIIEGFVEASEGNPIAFETLMQSSLPRK